jgi:hypothetical protein
MAKLDFCFTFYDGDATRDMAHMNRLERGAYMDFLIQQRQRGRLSKSDIQKFISKDFDSVWPSLQWILKEDSGLFYIEWLENSVAKSKTNAERQAENVRKRYQSSTDSLPKETSGNESALPLEDGNGNGNGIEDKNGRRKKEKEEPEPVPTPWETIAFRRAWESWRAYRKSQKLRWYKTPESESSALNSLKKICPSEAEAIAAIEHSIASLYQGIYPAPASKTGVKKEMTAVIDGDKYLDAAKKYNR